MPVRTFETKEKALEFITKIDWGTYYLRYGEYARPDYKARKIRGKDEYGVYATYYFYPGTFNAKKNGFLSWEETYTITIED